MNYQSLETTRKRTERYWYQDGIWEIGFGLINLLLAAHFSLTKWVLAHNLPALVTLVLQMVTFLGIFWVMARVVRFLKERITYPRTGYVAYRRAPLKARARHILLIGLFSAGIATGLTLVSLSKTISNTTPVVTGAIISAMIVFLGVRYSLMRMYGLAALTLALSVIVALLPIDEDSGQVLFFAGYGLLFLLSGGLALAIYLRRTRPLGDEQAEHPDYEAPASLEED